MDFSGFLIHDNFIPYGGKFWHCENLAKLMTDQNFVELSPSKFLHIYSKVTCECNTATFS